jgi:hypothetical protein
LLTWIRILGDEEAGVTGNNHVTQEEDNHVAIAATAPSGGEGGGGGGGAGETSHKKEKSVLQAKLTKLAIQVCIYIFIRLIFLTIDRVLSDWLCWIYNRRPYCYYSCHPVLCENVRYRSETMESYLRKLFSKASHHWCHRTRSRSARRFTVGCYSIFGLFR